MIDLTNKSFIIVGLKGSGKTNLAKHILQLTSQHLVYDPLRDFPEYNTYVPMDPHDKGEFAEVVAAQVIRWKPRLFYCEELNNFVAHNKPLPQPLQELNDWSRHYRMTWGGATRRPVDLHPSITGTVDYMFVFGLDGRNDRRFFDDMKLGLGDVVSGLEPYHFVVIENRRTVYIHNPVPRYEDHSYALA